jgi:glycosyltransferase involved in cell wall biosynthesis
MGGTGLKIFAGHDGGSGCCWYRVAVPLAEMARHGHEVTFRSGGNERGNRPITLAEMQGHDIVLGQRFNHYGGMGTWRKARTPTSRLVYEVDDDVFSVTPVNWQAFHVYSRPEIREAVTHQAQVSDLVTVTTEHLAGVMRAETGNENVAVLPNCIPGWVLDIEKPPQERPAIGWAGGASHGSDVGLVVNSVRRFLQRFPGWDFHLGGTDYSESFLNPNGRQLTRKPALSNRVLHVPWVPVYEQPRKYYEAAKFDIGLAPLLGTEFDLSKSNVKVLEYAARGIPAIATDCEVYSSFIRHGENGFLVKQEHEWLSYMSELANDDALRAKMGAAAKETAREYVIEKNWHLWEDAYASLFRSRAV